MALIELKSVALSHGGPPVLDGVDLRVHAGERISLARDECGFGYRRSAIDGLIMAVVLRLGRGDPDRLRASAAE